MNDPIRRIIELRDEAGLNCLSHLFGTVVSVVAIAAFLKIGAFAIAVTCFLFGAPTYVWAVVWWTRKRHAQKILDAAVRESNAAPSCPYKAERPADAGAKVSDENPFDEFLGGD